jgi:hypothetical protein
MKGQVKTQVVGISFPKKWIERIDLERGLIPRSKYIVHGLELAYGPCKEVSKV